jgi:GT2 family glycosyltransferase
MIEYTVVATTFNDENEIKEYLINICSQTFKPKAIVIADGGSSDSTVNIINNFSKDAVIPIVCLTGERLNISQGYNAAIKAAKTEYIGITGVGNSYADNYFETLANGMTPGLSITYSPVRGKNSNEFSDRYNKTILNGNTGMRMNIASNHGALVNKSVFDELGYFYENFIYAGEDAEFYELVRTKGYKTKMIDDAYVYWHTPNTWKEFLKQIKNYTIASMQINSYRQLMKIRKDVFKILLLIIGIIIVAIGFAHSCFVGIGLAVVLVIYFIMITDKANLIYIANTYLPIYYTLKYREYMAKKYKVVR